MKSPGFLNHFFLTSFFSFEELFWDAEPKKELGPSLQTISQRTKTTN
jgi:hypothetical protein